MSRPRPAKSAKPATPRLHAARKILSRAKLARVIAREHRAGRKIVFTNGCFDLLHRGHVEYLERARRLGDLLIVALNTDASVRKIKGPTRPVNPLQDRARVMAALACVDYVTAFGEPTPLQCILKLKPKYIVKGGDWKPAQIVGAREARNWGGRAKSLPYLKGRSTTAILKRSTG